jgi:hypothetical protein
MIKIAQLFIELERDNFYFLKKVKLFQNPKIVIKKTYWNILIKMETL